MFAALSVSFALNLYVAFGVRGDRAAAWVTQWAGIDTSALLAVIECALFAWFAVRLAGECAQRADGELGFAPLAARAGD